jgi:hypothetical protein
MQWNALQCNTIQYNTIQYNTIQYNTIQYNTIQGKCDYAIKIINTSCAVCSFIHVLFSYSFLLANIMLGGVSEEGLRVWWAHVQTVCHAVHTFLLPTPCGGWVFCLSPGTRYNLLYPRQAWLVSIWLCFFSFYGSPDSCWVMICLVEFCQYMFIRCSYACL